MSRTLFSLGAIAFCLLFCISPKLTAQGSNAAIVGSCFDSSGAAVPNATVEAREVNTNLKSESKTNTAGYYATTGHGPDLMEAARNAVRYMIRHLCGSYGFTAEEAYAMAESYGVETGRSGRLATAHVNS